MVVEPAAASKANVHSNTITEIQSKEPWQVSGSNWPKSSPSMQFLPFSWLVKPKIQDVTADSRVWP